MIDRAILLAASTADDPIHTSPLTEIGGRSLIQRSLTALEQQGLHDVVVVVGEDGAEIRRQVNRDPSITARIVWLPADSSVRSSLSAALRARAYVDGPALLLRSNLLFSPEIVAGLIDGDDTEECQLLVDQELSRVFDPEGAVKVRCRGDHVLDLGTSLDPCDAVAVGMAVVTPSLLDTLEEWESGSTQEALRSAARLGLFRAREVAAHAHWQQIDSPETKRHAEWLLRACGETLVSAERAADMGQGTGADPKRTLSYIEGLLSEKSARHYVLLNPGPVLTSARVKSALVHHDVCHRDEDCAAVVRRIRRKLRRVCGGSSEHDVLLLSGSGTAAMEATLASCVPEDGKLLVVSNGAFGERFAEIAAVHKIDTVHLRYEWGELVDPAEVERLLQDDDQIVAIVMCHHETSVGLLNPVHEVGQLCRRLGRMFFVDAVSSLGGESIDVRRDEIDVLFSSANKCLHAVSGVSFVCVNQRIWPRVDAIAPRVYYLDLRSYRRMQIPFTPAVSNLFALDAALDELLREGIEGRMARYRRLNSWLRHELSRMGFEPMTRTGRESHTITTWRVPESVTFDQLYRALKARGYIIYSCKAELKNRFFQIANMGDLTDEMVRGFVDALELVMRTAARTRVPELRVVS